MAELGAGCAETSLGSPLRGRHALPPSPPVHGRRRPRFVEITAWLVCSRAVRFPTSGGFSLDLFGYSGWNVLKLPSTDDL